ncbi:hypothetical protein ACO2Q0_17705 [Phenylobacterium sp. VNQ135]|uniref:hypothetical protein n=1 Tax=Phenylobacterium sp. VNQ135 TaxID=3400922 RepID=UPI003BFADF6B
MKSQIVIEPVAKNATQIEDLLHERGAPWALVFIHWGPSSEPTPDSLFVFSDAAPKLSLIEAEYGARIRAVDETLTPAEQGGGATGGLYDQLVWLRRNAFIASHR